MGAEATQYIAKKLDALKLEADEHDLVFIGYLIDMASIEAHQTARAQARRLHEPKEATRPEVRPLA